MAEELTASLACALGCGARACASSFRRLRARSKLSPGFFQFGLTPANFAGGFLTRPSCRVEPPR